MTTTPKPVPPYHGEEPVQAPTECPSCKSTDPTSRNGWMDLGTMQMHWCKHRWHHTKK